MLCRTKINKIRAKQIKKQKPDKVLSTKIGKQKNEYELLQISEHKIRFTRLY